MLWAIIDSDRQLSVQIGEASPNHSPAGKGDTMSFRDQLSGFIAEDKRQAAESLFDTLENLLAKNANDINTLKASLREKEGIKPEDFARLEKENADLMAKNTEAAGILKKLTKERDESVAKAQSESAANHRLLVDNGLTDALTKAGIRKELLPAARALLKEQGIISVETDGDVRRAVAKLADGKALPLEDYVLKHFALSDDGKAFIPADGNSGGGAGGPGRIAGAAKTMAFAAHQALGPKDQAAFFEEGGTLTV
jgi:hypothetical protein